MDAVKCGQSFPGEPWRAWSWIIFNSEKYFGLGKKVVLSDELYQLWLTELNSIYKAHKFIFSLAQYT